MSKLLLSLFALLLFVPNAGIAEVVSASPSGFVSQHTLLLDAEPTQAYEALTAKIHEWWDAEHSYSGKSSNFSLEAKAGGCFCEKLSDGEVEHMRVIFADAGRLLRMQGGLGPLQGYAVTGSMTFEFVATDEGSELRYVYVVGGYLPEGLDNWASAVDLVQLGQLKRLQAFLKEKARS